MLLEFFQKLPKHYIVSVSSFVIAFSFALQDYIRHDYRFSDKDYDYTQSKWDHTLDGEQDDRVEDDSTKDVALDTNALEKDAESTQTTSKQDDSPKAIEENDLPNERLLVVGKGDTLQGLLVSAGIKASRAKEAITAVKKVFRPHDLRLGQGLHIVTQRDPISGEIMLNQLDWRASPEKEIILKESSGRFIATSQDIVLKRCIEGVAGKIKSSLYQAAVRQGAPSSIVKKAIQALAHEINFQHEPKPGNGFAILYEVYRDPQGKVVKCGNLLYAAFAPAGKLRQIYYYKGPNGPSFYNQKGQCVVTGFLRSPLDVTRLRINSGYGTRMHPIKNYTKMHTGIDYGAPHGTHVVAAASGVVTKAQYWGGYGLYISIKHGDYTTAYAHLRKIAPGISVGSKVSQGQFIGEVGATGSATGPHLHFELLYKGSHINPNSVKTMPSHTLSKKDALQFASFKKTIDAKVSTRPEKGEYVLALNQTMLG